MSTSLSAPPASAAHGFSAFGLREELERAITANGYERPRPIQTQAIPAVLAGRDVLGLAQTGTGKTAAFALPILDRLLREPGPGPRVLVVAPTRELATQIDADFRSLARFTKIRTVTVFGGVSDRRQVGDLARRPHVVVACPGRLLDLYRQRAVSFDRIDTLVLDEADHMFDMGFLPDIRRILAALPAARQNLLFSATMPREIRGLAHETLREPVIVELAHDQPLSTIEHALYPVVEKRKVELLEHLIRTDGVASALVFTRTKHRARRLARDLDKAGYRAVALQGNMSQNARDRAMTGFRAGRFDILVATDIVARGIDVEQISHVFNFDVPNTPEAYTHRIGRTGRAERSGKAYTFVTTDDYAIVGAIERSLSTRIPRCRVDGFEEVTLSEADFRHAGRPATREQRRGGGGGGAGRGQRQRTRDAGGPPQREGVARRRRPRSGARPGGSGSPSSRPGAPYGERPRSQRSKPRADDRRGNGAAAGSSPRPGGAPGAHGEEGGRRDADGAGRPFRRRRRGPRRRS